MEWIHRSVQEFAQGRHKLSVDDFNRFWKVSESTGKISLTVCVNCKVPKIVHKEGLKYRRCERDGIEDEIYQEAEDAWSDSRKLVDLLRRFREEHTNLPPLKKDSRRSKYMAKLRVWEEVADENPKRRKEEFCREIKRQRGETFLQEVLQKMPSSGYDVQDLATATFNIIKGTQAEKEERLWKEFIEMKRRKDESLLEYTIRFDKAKAAAEKVIQHQMGEHAAVAHLSYTANRTQGEREKLGEAMDSIKIPMSIYKKTIQATYRFMGTYTEECPKPQSRRKPAGGKEVTFVKDGKLVTGVVYERNAKAEDGTMDKRIVTVVLDDGDTDCFNYEKMMWEYTRIRKETNKSERKPREEDLTEVMDMPDKSICTSCDSLPSTDSSLESFEESDDDTDNETDGSHERTSSPEKEERKWKKRTRYKESDTETDGCHDRTKSPQKEKQIDMWKKVAQKLVKRRMCL